MPLPAELSVPGYLQPPTQAQQQDLDMQRQALLEKSQQMIAKRVAVAKMQGDANQLQAAGLPPDEARAQAMMKNAPQLFGDNPEAMMQVTEQVQSMLDRKQALSNYRQRVSELMKDPNVSPMEASAKAMAEYGPGITTPGAFGSMIGQTMRAETTAKTAKAKMEQQADEFKQREARITANKEADLSTKQTIAEANLTQRQLEEHGRNARATGKGLVGVKYTPQQAEQIKTLRFEMSKLAQEENKLDPTSKDYSVRYQQFSHRLRDLHKQLDSVISTPGETPQTATAPDQSAPSGKVRVKNAAGEEFWLPETQLGDALKAGYEQVK